MDSRELAKYLAEYISEAAALCGTLWLLNPEWMRETIEQGIKAFKSINNVRGKINGIAGKTL